jgi:hypothetical protein
MERQTKHIRVRRVVIVMNMNMRMNCVVVRIIQGGVFDPREREREREQEKKRVATSWKQFCEEHRRFSQIDDESISTPLQPPRKI